MFFIMFCLLGPYFFINSSCESVDGSTSPRGYLLEDKSGLGPEEDEEDFDFDLKIWKGDFLVWLFAEDWEEVRLKVHG